MMTIFMFALLVCGVFGDEVSVMEGDSLTLHTKFTDTQREEILWKFGPEGSSKLLVHIDGSTPNIKDIEGFKDRLQILNIQSGDLIIKNIRKKHTGLYKAVTEGDAGTFEKKFNVIVYDAPDVLDAGTDEVKSVSVTVGGSVPLNTDIKLHTDDLIVWRFGPKGVLIVKDDTEDNKTPEYPDARFKGRLQLNNLTGDLIIKDLKYTDSGVYKLKISSNKQIIHKTFSLSVRGVVTDESVSVMEGESVTLHTDITDIQKDEMLWKFGPEGSSSLLVQIVGSKPDITNDVRFKDRLQISDILSGNLTIKNMRKKHAGLYTAVIEGAPGKFQKIFNVIVYDAPGVLDVGTDEVKSVLGTEGESVTLNTDVNLQRDALILWRFGYKGALIAKDDVDDNKTPEYPDERFRDRLQVNDQTGDFIISKVTYEDSGVYKLKISNNKEIIHKTFSLSVRAGLSSGGIAGLCLFFLLVIAASAVAVFLYLHKKQPVIMMSVPEGDTLALPSSTSELPIGTQIEWKFKGHVIMTAMITEDRVIRVTHTDDQQFKDRLKCNPYFGHLIIKPILKKDTGLYEVKITNNKETSHAKIQVNVTDGYMAPFEGDPVNLHGADSVLQTGAQIVWKFNNCVIMSGQMTKDNGVCEIYKDDQQFKDRLELGDDLGYLLIKPILSEDTGVYEVNITNNKETSHHKIQVNVIGGSTKEDLNKQTRGMIVLTVFAGDPVALRGAESKLQTGTQIEWKFKDRVIIRGEKTNDREIHVTHSDDQFKDRLELDHSVGYLLINDISYKDSGVYEVNITNNKGTSRNKTHVIVIARKEPTARDPLLSV